MLFSKLKSNIHLKRFTNLKLFMIKGLMEQYYVLFSNELFFRSYKNPSKDKSNDELPLMIKMLTEQLHKICLLMKVKMNNKLMMIISLTTFVNLKVYLFVNGKMDNKLISFIRLKIVRDFNRFISERFIKSCHVSFINAFPRIYNDLPKDKTNDELMITMLIGWLHKVFMLLHETMNKLKDFKIVNLIIKIVNTGNMLITIKAWCYLLYYKCDYEKECNNSCLVDVGVFDFNISYFIIYYYNFYYTDDRNSKIRCDDEGNKNKNKIKKKKYNIVLYIPIEHIGKINTLRGNIRNNCSLSYYLNSSKSSRSLKLIIYSRSWYGSSVFNSPFMEYMLNRFTCIILPTLLKSSENPMVFIESYRVDKNFEPHLDFMGVYVLNTQELVMKEIVYVNYSDIATSRGRNRPLKVKILALSQRGFISRYFESRYFETSEPLLNELTVGLSYHFMQDITDQGCAVT